MKHIAFHHGDKISELTIYTSVISLNTFKRRKILKNQFLFHVLQLLQNKKSLKNLRTYFKEKLNLKFEKFSLQKRQEQICNTKFLKKEMMKKNIMQFEI